MRTARFSSPRVGRCEGGGRSKHARTADADHALDCWLQPSSMFVGAGGRILHWAVLLLLLLSSRGFPRPRSTTTITSSSTITIARITAQRRFSRLSMASTHPPRLCPLILPSLPGRGDGGGAAGPKWPQKRPATRSLCTPWPWRTCLFSLVCARFMASAPYRQPAPLVLPGSADPAQHPALHHWSCPSPVTPLSCGVPKAASTQDAMSFQL